MNIKIVIANYGTEQLQHLYKSIEEFKSYKKYKVDITVYTTVPVNEKHKLYHPGVERFLPFTCRRDLADDIDNYDLFLYNENDHLITEDNIDAFLEHTATLSDNQVSGFIRYEMRDGEKILLDLNPAREFALVNQRYENNFSIHNLHQGCFLLTRQQLKKITETEKFFMLPSSIEYSVTGMCLDLLEQGASDPYTKFGLEKVFPKDLKLLERLLIWHLPIKYSIMDLWIKHGITIDKLQKY